MRKSCSSADVSLRALSERVHHAFALAITVIGLGLIAWCVWTASRSWFLGDDFAFLSLARRAKAWRDWWKVFVPLGRRGWWSYRPLTIDLYFHLGYRAFGLNAFGYLLISLLFHVASGALVYRLARQLHFDCRVAAVAALLSLCRYPSMTQLFWVSAFQHVAAKFFFLLAASLFLDYARGAPARYQLASCGAFILALLSNELAATLPGVLVALALLADGGGRSELTRRALRRPLPHFIVGTAYLLFRLGLFHGGGLGGVYTTAVGWHVLANYERYTRFVLDDHPLKIWGAALLAGGTVAAIVAKAEDRARIVRELLRMHALLLAWISVVMIPFAGFLAPHHRFAMIMEPPASLLAGAYLNAAWQAFGTRHARTLEAALIAGLVAAIPYGLLWSRTVEPTGWSNRRLIELIDRHHPGLPERGCVVFLYGAEDLAGKAEADLFKFRVGGLFGVVYPGRRVAVYFHDVRQPEQAPDGCLRFKIDPGLRVDPADG